MQRFEREADADADCEDDYKDLQQRSDWLIHLEFLYSSATHETSLIIIYIEDVSEKSGEEQHLLAEEENPAEY